MKKILSIFTVLTLSLLLIACSNGNVTTNPADQGDKVKVSHYVSSIDTGQTNSSGAIVYAKEHKVELFNKNPKRVVSFSLGVVDMLDTVGIDKLGIELFATPKASLPENLKKYDAEPYLNAGTLFLPDMEALQLMQPDLIILDGRTSSQYVALKAAFPNADILDASNTTYSLYNHFDIATTLGNIFSSAKEAFDKEMSEIALEIFEIRRLTSTTKALFILSNGSGISASGIGTAENPGRYATLHTDFGFLEADPNGKVGDAHGDVVSLEYLTLVNPEVIFILDRAATIGQESGLNGLFEEPQFKALDAFKSGNVFVLDGPSWYTVTGGFNSTRQMIADVQKYIDHLSAE